VQSAAAGKSRRIKGAPRGGVAGRIGVHHHLQHPQFLDLLADAGNLRFAYWEYHGEDFEADARKMAADPVTRQWWALTDPCQEPYETREVGEYGGNFQLWVIELKRNAAADPRRLVVAEGRGPRCLYRADWPLGVGSTRSVGRRRMTGASALRLPPAGAGRQQSALLRHSSQRPPMTALEPLRWPSRSTRQTSGKREKADFG
jgi:hypothetical protein